MFVESWLCILNQNSRRQGPPVPESDTVNFAEFVDLRTKCDSDVKK